MYSEIVNFILVKQLLFDSHYVNNKLNGLTCVVIGIATFWAM